MTERQLVVLSRILKTQEGRDLLDEVLIPMYTQNHIDLLQVDKSMRDETIGFGLCLQHLISLFEKSEAKLAERLNNATPNLI